jgi:mRNA interferase RelE/StbE
MSTWSLEFSQEAAGDIGRFDPATRRRIIGALERLANRFDTTTPTVLHGAYHGFYKLRVGDWRAVYAVQWAQHTIIVHYIDRRDKIYKRRNRR